MKDSYFSALYKYAPVGIAILDGNMKIVSINAFLLSLVSLPPKDCKGQSLGEALRCASIHNSDKKCGETPNCAACRLRRGFRQALEQDMPVRNAEVSHSFMIGSLPVIKTLRFSASATETPQGIRIITSFSDISREKQLEMLLMRELDLQASPSIINRQNLLGIVAELMLKAGPDNAVSVGLATVEGLNDAAALNGLSGSEVLNRFSEIARQCTRRQDIIGRVGNTTFLFVFSGAGIQMAQTISRRIHDTMSAVFTAQGIKGVSFSAGFTELNTAQLSQLTSDDVLRTVDGCLQTARKRGSMFVAPELSALLK